MRILSVRPSVTCVNCDKTVERSVQIYIPYTCYLYIAVTCIVSLMCVCVCVIENPIEVFDSDDEETTTGIVLYLVILI